MICDTYSVTRSQVDISSSVSDEEDERTAAFVVLGMSYKPISTTKIHKMLATSSF